MSPNAIKENAELKEMTMTDKNKSTVEKLSELKQLYDAGLLTETEMEAVKAEILGEVDLQQDEEERQNFKQPIDNGDDSKPSLRKRILRYAIRGIIGFIVFFFFNLANPVFKHPLVRDRVLYGFFFLRFH